LIGRLAKTASGRGGLLVKERRKGKRDANQKKLVWAAKPSLYGLGDKKKGREEKNEKKDFGGKIKKGEPQVIRLNALAPSRKKCVLGTRESRVAQIGSSCKNGKGDQ